MDEEPRQLEPEQQIEEPTLQPELAAAEGHHTKADGIRTAAEAIRTILIVVVLAFLLRAFVFQPYKVEGSSMDPLFETNDHLIVEKLSYRFAQPQRGDIVVFRYPYSPDTSYVKRIIGLPGERVLIEDGTVRVFNSANPNGFQLDESYLENGRETSVSAAGRNEFSVTADHYFVMGDNRPASSDSREWGLLPKENIIGRAVVKTYPLGEISWIEHAEYTQ